MTLSVTMFSAFLYLLYFSTLRVVLFLLQYSVHVHATVYLLLKKQEKKKKKIDIETCGDRISSQCLSFKSFLNS